jgi:hypothetical protein
MTLISLHLLITLKSVRDDPARRAAAALKRRVDHGAALSKRQSLLTKEQLSKSVDNVDSVLDAVS